MRLQRFSAFHRQPGK